MCKLVAELVGADTQLMREVFRRLEVQSGGPGIDVRLTGEIYGKLHMKMRALGLDPNDSTPHELYQALLNLTALHDEFLAKRLHIEVTDNADVISEAVARFVNRLHMPKQAWVFKCVAAKKLLKAAPPKTLMKLLHYRSLDSMLKRESAIMLVTVARHIEPEQWQKRFVSSYKKLKPNDFEVRDIVAECLPAQRWQAVGEYIRHTRHTTIVHTPEAGGIALLPIEAQGLRGLTLATLLLTLHYVNEIRAFSTFAKFNHMSPKFGNNLVEHILGQKQDHFTLAGQSIHWRVVHQYYGHPSRQHPEIFEPHVQAEDLAYRKAEEVLYRMEPALHFWHDMDYTGLPHADGVLSFNLTDMALNLVNRLPYENRISYHMVDALWNEIYCRYTSQHSFEQQILQQLDEQSASKKPSVLDLEFVW